MSPLRGIRGAVQAPADSPDAIDASTRALLREMVDRNGIAAHDVVAIWFTQTPDLTAAHAATSARKLGWRHVPLLGAQEAPVGGQMARGRVIVVVIVAVTATRRPGPQAVIHLVVDNSVSTAPTH